MREFLSQNDLTTLAGFDIKKKTEYLRTKMFNTLKLSRADNFLNTVTI